MLNRCKSIRSLHKQDYLQFQLQLQLPPHHPSMRVERRSTVTSGSMKASVLLPSLDASTNTRCRWTRRPSSLWASITVFRSGTSAPKLCRCALSRSSSSSLPSLRPPPPVLPVHGVVQTQLQLLPRPSVNPCLPSCRLLKVSKRLQGPLPIRISQLA